MTERQHFDKSSDRDDADARGEHLYDDENGRRQSSLASPWERDPNHYAAGANGTQAVITKPPAKKTDATRDSAIAGDAVPRDSDDVNRGQ